MLPEHPIVESFELERVRNSLKAGTSKAEFLTAWNARLTTEQDRAEYGISPEMYDHIVCVIKRDDRIKVTIKQPPHVDVMLTGLNWREFRSLMCCASLHCYDELAKLESQPETEQKQESLEYHKHLLHLLDVIKDKDDAALKAHNAHFKTWAELTPKQRERIKKENAKGIKWPMKVLKHKQYRKNRQGRYE